MKNALKRMVSALLCVIMLAGILLVDPPTAVEATNHGQYATLAMVYDQGSCPSMQGLALCGSYFYAIKADGNDYAAAVCRVNKDTGSKTWLTNSANSTYYFYDFGHGNDVEVVSAGGVTTMFVPTSKTGSNSLVRYSISGTTATKVGGYNMVTTSGSSLGGGAIRAARVDDENIYFLFKSGSKMYTGTLPISQTSGDLVMTYMCTLDYSTVYINGTAVDTSAYSLQGMGYYDHMLYLPISGHTTSDVNISLIAVYDLEGASGTIKPLPDPTFKVTSSTYSALFEIESCVVNPNDGLLYFNTNRRKTSSDTNHDGIHYITNWVYEPDQRTTEVHNYRWEMVNDELVSVTDGGAVYNGLAMHEGGVSGGTITSGRYATSKTVVLEHDRPWILEWKSNGCSSGQLLFATQAVSNYSGAPYIFVNGKNARVSIGAYDGSQYNNYGVTLADHGIDGTKTHVYRLTNKIASDGTNMVYLSVDGEELGAMNNYHIGSTSQGTTSDWVSGQDFRFSYLGTAGHKVNDSIEYIQVWGDGMNSAYDEPNIYRWEDQGSGLTNVSDAGLTANALTTTRGTYSGGTYTTTQMELTQEIVLLHDRPWSLEWQSDGSWSGGALLFASDHMSKTYGSPYIFRNSGSILAIGAHDGAGYNHYGVKLTDYGITNADSHIYRLTNRINADGSNMVYLYVDGEEIAPMNTHFVGGTNQGTTSDWLSGKDFTFGYMGTYQHPVNSAGMDYVQVWESGIPEEDMADTYRWETQNDALVSVSTDAYTENTANVISGSCAEGVYTKSQFILDRSVMLLHDREWSIEWQMDGNWTGGGMMLSSAKQSNTLNNTYLFRSNIISLGYRDGSQYNHYGIVPAEYGIDRAGSHVYCLTNRVSADGSNMVYLYVDGVELGAMNNYYINGSTTSSGTSDWLSGKDFVFSYMGTINHPVNDVALSYIQISEGELPTGVVEFRDWDGTVISSAEYHYGDTVTVPADPTRASDETNNYYFAGWDKKVVACAGDAVYTATYTTEKIEYTVEFRDYDGTLLSSAVYNYGDTVAVPADPSRASDDTYSYVFAAWDQPVTACTGSTVYTAAYTAKLIPVITPKYPSLSFEGEIYYNVYFETVGMEDVAPSDMGLITWVTPQIDGTMDNAEAVIPGVTDEGNGSYAARSSGIPAKNLADSLYFKVYAKLSDGSYIYSDMYRYSAKDYADDRLANSTSDKMKALCVAMLNYGAAAQTHFSYRPYDLMNADLTAEQRALVSDYRSDMVAGVSGVDSAKVGEFTYNSAGYTSRYPSVSFEGAFSINYYFTPALAVDGDMTLYYWDQATYNSVSILTMDNATGSVVMDPTDFGAYMGVVDGIAAKDIDSTIFVAGVYTSGGVSYATGVLPYSLGAYCVDRINNGSGTMRAFAAETAIYGYYAKQYFT